MHLYQPAILFFNIILICLYAFMHALHSVDLIQRMFMTMSMDDLSYIPLVVHEYISQCRAGRVRGTEPISLLRDLKLPSVIDGPKPSCLPGTYSSTTHDKGEPDGHHRHRTQ